MRWRDGGEGRALQQFAQFGLAGEHQGDVGAGVEVKVDHAFDGGESGGCRAKNAHQRR